MSRIVTVCLAVVLSVALAHIGYAQERFNIDPDPTPPTVPDNTCQDEGGARFDIDPGQDTNVHYHCKWVKKCYVRRGRFRCRTYCEWVLVKVPCHSDHDVDSSGDGAGDGDDTSGDGGTIR